MVGLVCRGLLGRPLVITVRGSDVNLARRHPVKLVMRFVAAKAEAIICVSNDLKGQILGWGIPPDKVSSFPEGIDSIETNMERESDLLLFVGRFAPEKGLGDLFKALAVVSQTHLFRLQLAGDGPLRDELSRMAASVPGPSEVRFLGRIPREEVAKTVSGALLLVLPSLSEGLPDTILTSMACGTPVLSTKIPGVEQVIDDGKTGVLVNPSSPDELASALATIIENPVRAKRLGKRGLMSVRKRFHRPRMIEKLIRIVRDLSQVNSNHPKDANSTSGEVGIKDQSIGLLAATPVDGRIIRCR
jgi:glycosyltransferase involved in cell wall biosynthesis